MTDREVLDVSEMKIRLWTCASGRCEVCGRAIAVTDAQLAHRIPKSVMNLKKYGKSYIHHPLNLAVTCAGCNQRVIVHGEAERILIEEIERAKQSQERRHPQPAEDQGLGEISGDGINQARAED